MYLTAQRVRNHKGLKDLHAFLHLHDLEPTALSLPFRVPQNNPGRLVMQSSPMSIPPGGNSVVSYLDVVVDDLLGKGAHPDLARGLRPWWQNSLESLGKRMVGLELP